MQPEDTQSFETVEEGPPPPAGPPPGLIDDVWPWLLLLGVLAVAGFLVWLFVFHNRHHHRHVVPAVVGLQQRVAIDELTRDGYSVKAIVGAANKPRGIVASQEPGGGSQLPKGSSVTIHVSNGQAVTTTPATTAAATTTATTTAAAPTSAVPSVTGQDMASGAGQVEAAGFVAETDPAASAGGTAGSIVSETPPGGTQAKAGDTVTLQVAVPSSRPTVQVPDVTGRSASDARAALLQAKLTVRTTYKAGKTGVVLAESPTGSVPAYTQVTIAVGK